MNRFHIYLILGFLLVFLILLFYSVIGKLSYDSRDMSNTKLIAASNPSNSVITILNDIASRVGVMQVILYMWVLIIGFILLVVVGMVKMRI